MQLALTKRGETIAYIALIGALFAASFFIPDGIVSNDLELPASTRPQAVLDLLHDLQQFTGALNTALFAACGALVTFAREGRFQWQALERYVLAATLAAGAGSYYGLYLARIAVLEMVSTGVIDPFNRRL